MSNKEEFFERFEHTIIEMELKVLDEIWQWIEEKLGKEYRRGFRDCVDYVERYIDGQEKDLLEYERRIEQFEKELRLYTTIIREHGLEVKE